MAWNRAPMSVQVRGEKSRRETWDGREERLVRENGSKMRKIMLYY